MRSRRRSKPKHALAAGALALALTGCSAAPPSAPPPAARIGGKGGSLLPVPKDPSAASTTQKPGVLKFVITDARGRIRRDVPIRYGMVGRARTVVYSDARGRATITIPGSTYAIDIPNGCWPKVRIFRGQTLRVGVVPGTTREVRLRVLEMERRYTASPPMSWSPEPPWEPGTTARITFTLWDRCKDVAAGPIPFPDLTYHPSAAVRVRDEFGKTADARSRAMVEIECLSPDDPTLFFGDPVDPADRVDILALRRPFSGARWCA